MRNIIIKKGCYGYIRNRKAVTAVRTAVYIILSVSLYIAGYVTTGTSRNLLTVVAILGCLPACKSMVNFILFLKASGCSGKLKEQVSPYDGKLTVFYDMYFTSYQKDYPISHMALKGGILYGITEKPKCGCGGAEKHIEQLLAQEGIKNVAVKIYSEPDEYIDRLSQLSSMDVDEHRKRDKIINMLYSVTI